MTQLAYCYDCKNHHGERVQLDEADDSRYDYHCPECDTLTDMCIVP